MRAYERFLQYAVIHTTSDDTSGLTPSSQCQFDLARHLVEEMHRLGIPDAHVDGKCYVYGSIPASPGCEDLPALGFCAHLDTASFNGKNVRPRLVPDYDGGDIVLGTSGRVLSPAQFPHLPQLRGGNLLRRDHFGGRRRPLSRLRREAGVRPGRERGVPQLLRRLRKRW